MLAQSHFRVEKTASSVRDLQSQLNGGAKPDFLLVGGTDNTKITDQVRQLRQQFEEAIIVVFSSGFVGCDVLRMLRAGANGVLDESLDRSALFHALKLIMRDTAVVPIRFVKEICAQSETMLQTVSSRNGNHMEPGKLVRTLSAREISILRCLVRGLSNKEIARELEIAETTVKVHVKAVLRKIQVKNRTQAAIWASQILLTNNV